METQRSALFGRRESDQQHGVQYELLKVIAEYNKERILEYDVATDCAILYEVKNGKLIARLISDGYKENIDQYASLYAKEDREKFKKAFLKCLEASTHSTIDIRCNLNGEMEWYRLFLASIADDNGKVFNIAGRFLSIHDEKLVNETIRRKAEIDALTGVYNHITFENLCAECLGRIEGEVMFLMMDVDDFKMINDSLGHNVGDMVLSQTGLVLNSAMETRGIAGRLGGDEFAALVWGFPDREAVSEFCSNLRMELKNIIFDMEYSASMGVSVRAGRQMTFKDLYYEADQAVYVAKKNGKNQIIYYDEIEETDENDEADEVDTSVAVSVNPGERVLRSYERFVINEHMEYLFVVDMKGENILYANRVAKEKMRDGENAWLQLSVDDLLCGSPMDYKKEENQAEFYFVSRESVRCGNGLTQQLGPSDYMVHVVPYKLRGKVFKMVSLIDLSDQKHMNSVMLKRQELQKAVEKCMLSLIDDDFSVGYARSLQQLCDFYDADCAAIVYYNDGTYNKIEEFHRPNAEIMAKIFKNAAFEGKLTKFEPLVGEDGKIFLPKVTKIKEKYPILYTKLVDNRVWSLAGTYLERKDKRAGILVLLNPRHNLGENHVMRVFSSYLATEILRWKNKE